MREKTSSQKSFADLEFACQGVVLDRLLQQISDLLDKHSELVDVVHEDLVQGLKNCERGRRAMTAEQVLRSFIVQRARNLTYRDLRERIADGYTLRHFTRFASAKVPKFVAFQRDFARLTPQSLRRINDLVAQAAVALGQEDGKKLRVDTTVVETNIHHPTDSSLLWDGVRVITRLCLRIGEHLPQVLDGFCDRTLRAKRRMAEIARMTNRTGKRQRTWRRKYADLLRTTSEVIRTATEVTERARRTRVANPLEGVLITALCDEVAHYAALTERVIEQTRRRVFNRETVPADEKLYSLFEAHTDLIVRGKARKPVEFGHKVFVAESAIGLITDYRVLDGNPSDADQVEPSLKQHRKTFGQAPALYAGDRGFDSPEAQKACADAQVKVPSIPQRGGKLSSERAQKQKGRAFKKGQRFRSGVEGRISVLFRGRGMKRSRLRGRQRFELFVGAAVLANNLLVIAERLERKAKRRSQRRKAA
jgi:IS5 family transposase